MRSLISGVILTYDFLFSYHRSLARGQDKIVWNDQEKPNRATN